MANFVLISYTCRDICLSDLPVVPCEEERDRLRAAARNEKLSVGEHIRLPHPLTIDGWEMSPQNLPNVQPSRIEQYFHSSKVSFFFYFLLAFV